MLAWRTTGSAFLGASRSSVFLTAGTGSCETVSVCSDGAGCSSVEDAKGLRVTNAHKVPNEPLDPPPIPTPGPSERGTGAGAEAFRGADVVCTGFCSLVCAMRTGSIGAACDGISRAGTDIAAGIGVATKRSFPRDQEP